MSIQISPVVSADLEQIATLARIVWQSTYPGIISQAQIDFMLAQLTVQPVGIEFGIVEIKAAAAEISVAVVPGLQERLAYI